MSDNQKFTVLERYINISSCTWMTVVDIIIERTYSFVCREREAMLLDYLVKYHELKSRWKILLVLSSQPGRKFFHCLFISFFVHINEFLIYFFVHIQTCIALLLFLFCFDERLEMYATKLQHHNKNVKDAQLSYL